MIIPENYFEKQNRFLPYLLICLFVVLIYFPSFTGEFILDDISLVEKNEYLREWHSIGSYLSQEDGYDKNLGGHGHTGYYRPLINLFYTLDYKVWGMFAPGFRITNTILHLLVCFSLFSLYNLILNKRYIALMLALIFSLHPVNTETVSWITSRNNILVTLFGILSLIFYIRSYRNQKYYEYILSVIFFSFAVFCKEFGLMLLPVFFLYQRIFNDEKKITFIELREYCPFIIVSIIYFFFRHNVIESLLTPAGFSDVFTRIYNFPYVFLLNLKLVFFPYKLHSFFIKYPENILNTASLISIFLILMLVILLWIYRKNRILIFFVIAFFILLFPVLNIIPTSAPYLIAMRWLYFPMPFILMILTLPIEKLYGWNKKMTLYLFIGILICLGSSTYTLNRFLWHSPEDFFKQEVGHFNNRFYYDGMGFIYGKEKKYELAMKFHEMSISEGIRLNINYIEYAELLIEKGRPEKALEYLDKAWNVNFAHNRMARILHDKGVIYFKLNNLAEAERNILQAINLSPDEPVYWEDLGVVQGGMGRHKDAIESFKKALRFGIDSKSIFKNMAAGYISNNECQKALKLIKRINKNEKDAGLNMLQKKAEQCLADSDT
jgi:Tfp pilus assembly protein PilF